MNQMRMRVALTTTIVTVATIISTLGAPFKW